MAVELELISVRGTGKDTQAKIQANNMDEAVAYFKGRFGITGKFVARNGSEKRNIFNVRSKR